MSINIWVGNYGHYNNGYLVGDWITLPMEHHELWDTIKKVCKCDRFNEEVGIFDYECDEFDVRISEYESIDQVNALAAAIEQLNSWQEDAVAAWMDYESYDLMELANACMDADNIPFYGYEVSCDWMSNEEKLGYTMMNLNPDLQKKLEDYGIESYFDYERYGRDMAQDCYLTDEGYLDLQANSPDTSWYDAHGLLEELGYWDDDNETEAA